MKHVSIKYINIKQIIRKRTTLKHCDSTQATFHIDVKHINKKKLKLKIILINKTYYFCGLLFNLIDMKIEPNLF